MPGQRQATDSHSQVPGRRGEEMCWPTGGLRSGGQAVPIVSSEWVASGSVQLLRPVAVTSLAQRRWACLGTGAGLLWLTFPALNLDSHGRSKDENKKLKQFTSSWTPACVNIHIFSLWKTKAYSLFTKYHRTTQRKKSLGNNERKYFDVVSGSFFLSFSAGFLYAFCLVSFVWGLEECQRLFP